MLINKKVSIIEINQNFSKVAKIASEEGSVVATQNNKLEYILLKKSITTKIMKLPTMQNLMLFLKSDASKYESM